MKRFWRFVWDVSEFAGIGLGRFAPFVFGRMIGRKGARVEGESIWHGMVMSVTMFERPVNFSGGETLSIDHANGRWFKVSPSGEILDSRELRADESQNPKD